MSACSLGPRTIEQSRLRDNEAVKATSELVGGLATCRFLLRLVLALEAHEAAANAHREAALENGDNAAHHKKMAKWHKEWADFRSE